MRKWWLSLRPFSLPISILSIMLGLVIAGKTTYLDPIGALLALATGLVLHIIANVFNSYFDWKLGHDQSGDSQVVPLLMDPNLGAKALWAYGLAFLILGIGLTIILGLRYNPLVMIIALVGLLNAYFYTAPPIAYKKRGLGLPLVFISMGILMPLNAFLIQTMDLNYQIIANPVPLALLITAILQGNELRDYHSDLQHGINSFSAIYGLKAGIKLYQLLVIVPYIMLIFLIFAGLLPVFVLVVFLSSRYALTLVQRADQHDFKGLDSATAKLHAAFGLLYILAQVIG